MNRSTLITAATLLAVLSGCPKPAPPPTTSQPADAPARLRTLTPPKAGPKTVALFVPHEDLFWVDFREFMQASADQFGIELKHFVAENNREQMKKQLREATSGPNAVDAVVFQSFKQNGEDLLQIADEAGVPAFLVNVGVDPARCGAPRERIAHWLGTMVSDSVGSGQDLTNLLADRAKELGLVDADGKVHMIAVAGIVSDQGSNDRLAGLELAVKTRGDIVLHQVVPTDWSREAGKLKTGVLLKRYPATSVVWAASDPLALGAIDSLKEAGRKPGLDSIVGGFDWTAEALEAIRRGEMHATLGGEYMAGGWAVVLLHDYFEGRDFVSKRVEYQTQMRPITSQNVERFTPAISAADWKKVDFRSLAAPGAGEDYVFDAVKTLEDLTQ